MSEDDLLTLFEILLDELLKEKLVSLISKHGNLFKIKTTEGESFKF